MTSATLWPRSCSRPSAGVSRAARACRWPRGPWWRRRPRRRGRARRARNAAEKSSWSSNTRAGASTTRCSRADRGHLDHGAAQVAREHAQAAVGRERFGDPAQHVGSQRLRPARRASPAAVVQERAPAGSGPGPGPATVVTSSCSRPASSSSPISERPCRRRRGSGSRRPRRWGRSRASSGTTADRSAKSSQVELRCRRPRAMATRCSVWLVDPPVASSADARR